MPKWRIIIPVLIVAVVGLIAVMQLPSSVSEEPAPSAPVVEEPVVDIADQPLDVSGEEDVGTQADALIDELLGELDDEESLAGDGTAEINAETAGEQDSDILDVEYYEE